VCPTGTWLGLWYNYFVAVGMKKRKLLSKRVKELLRTHNKGVHIDLGGGLNPQPGCINIDKRALPTVDIIWDLEEIPYPLPDECASLLIASHIVEHLKPWLFIDIMNEWWRLLKPLGRLMIATPYAGSKGFYQDPTHCNPCNEVTWAYFDPLDKSGLYRIYVPKPWKIVANMWNIHGNMEVVLEKRVEDKSYVNNIGE